MTGDETIVANQPAGGGSTLDQASFEAVSLIVDLDEHRRLLDDVSFHLDPCSLLAVVGPSGAGKTTLLNALTGFRPADTGSVFYGGRNLYTTYEELRYGIGYVPQENILHDQLTVERALRYAAELRFPPSVDAATRRRRVTEVIEELDLAHSGSTRISVLSGGQRKRVNVALELLTQPSLVFLDEPTSGLDPGNERELMSLLRSLASAGRVVVVVTHSAQSLDLCDRVLFLAPGGKLAYFGPPQDALAYFDKGQGEGGYAAVFSALEEDESGGWKERFRSSPEYAKYVQQAAETDATRAQEARRPLPPPPQHTFWRQLGILSRRQVSLIASDRKALATLALQAPILALLFLIVFSSNALSTENGQAATLLVWLLAVGATWLGVSNSIREIVNEYPVYRRERAVGLSIGPYVLSKALVLGAITAVQAFALVGISLARQPVPVFDRIGIAPHGFHDGSVFGSQWIEIAIGVAVVGIAAVSIGLLASTLVRSSTQALTVLPLILAAEIVLSLPIPGMRIDALAGFTGADWGTSAVGSTVSLNVLRTPMLVGEAQGRADVKYDELVIAWANAGAPRSPSAVWYDIAGHAHSGPPRQRSIAEAIANDPFYRKHLEDAARGEERWDHDAGTWFLGTGLLAVMTVAGLGGAWFTLRRRDLRILAEAPKTRVGPQPRPLDLASLPPPTAALPQAPPNPPGS